MRGFILKLKKYNSFKLSKKGVTFAGALVFFAILGLVPTIYLFSLTLSVFGKELSVLGGFFIANEFNDVKNFVFESASKIGAGGNVIAGTIAIYSAGSLFVHLRFIGETIYGFKSNGTIITRILSIIACILISLVLSFLTVIYAFISQRFILIFGVFANVLNCFMLFLIVFIAVVLLNLFACPKKVKIKNVIKGSMLSCILCVIFTLVFIIYLKYFSSYNEVYGSLSAIVVFLIWLFIIMRSLVNGILLNAYLGSNL